MSRRTSLHSHVSPTRARTRASAAVGRSRSACGRAAGAAGAVTAQLQITRSSVRHGATGVGAAHIRRKISIAPAGTSASASISPSPNCRTRYSIGTRPSTGSPRYPRIAMLRTGPRATGADTSLVSLKSCRMPRWP